MLKKAFAKVFGTSFDRELKRIQPIIDRIHEVEVDLAQLSDDEIQAQTAKLRGILADKLGELRTELDEKRKAKHECADPVERDVLTEEVNDLEDELKSQTVIALDDILPEAFATVREACRRLVGTSVVVTGHALDWDMVPYDVQLIGGLVFIRARSRKWRPGRERRSSRPADVSECALPGAGATS